MIARHLLAPALLLALAAGCASLDIAVDGFNEGLDHPDARAAAADLERERTPPEPHRNADGSLNLRSLQPGGDSARPATPPPQTRAATRAWPETAGEAEAGWSRWRGPYQSGVSDERNLPDTLSAENQLWKVDLKGRGTAVTLGDRLYVMGYAGAGPDLREYLVCLDADSGSEHWRLGFNDFLSDIIYERYSIGAPSVDPVSGDIYALTSAGELICATPLGEIRWNVSLTEQFGRLTFPNGRTGTPTVDGDLVIVNLINSNWGAEGPGRNRFYAFHRSSGELVWSSTPGVGPPFLRDSSFSTPIFETRAGMRLMLATTGCGNVVCVNALTGEPLWRYQMAEGGVNSSPVIAGNRLVAVHGKENVDDTGRGRMLALDLDQALRAALADGKADEPLLLDRSYELWRNDAISQFTSSPVINGERIYVVTGTGDLHAVDLATGKTRWHLKLGADQLHASPLWADGKLYIPMWHDGVQIIRPDADGGVLLGKTKLPGDCIGSPTVWRGRVYIHTTEGLFCFGPETPGPAPAAAQVDAPPPAGAASALRLQPAEVLLRPGARQQFHAYPVDAQGVRTGDAARAEWAKWVPPSARVKAELDADLDQTGLLSVGPEARQSAGALRAVAGELSGTARGRIVPAPPYHEDFEAFALTAKDEAGTAFAYPPLAWIGARGKWDVRELEGNKVLAKTLDNILFMRAMSFVGHPEDRDYTLQADVMSDGNRRNLGMVGVIHQRYVIALVGNWQILEVSSNHDRIKYSVPYAWQPNTWYTLKTRVDADGAGGAVVRAKVWPRGTDEPAAWTLEMPHASANLHGAPGLFGFSLQSQYKCYIDNLHITPN